MHGDSRRDLRGDFDRDLDRESRGQDVSLPAVRLGPSAITVLLVVSILFAIHSSPFTIHVRAALTSVWPVVTFIYKVESSHTDRPSAPALISDH